MDRMSLDRHTECSGNGWGVSKSFLGAPAGGGDGHGQKVTGTDKRCQKGVGWVRLEMVWKTGVAPLFLKLCRAWHLSGLYTIYKYIYI